MVTEAECRWVAEARERGHGVLLGHHRALHGDRGLSSVEYSLATVGVAGLLTAAVLGLGEHLATVFDCMSRQLNGPTAACGAPPSPDDPAGDPAGDEGTGRSGTGEQPDPTSTETTTNPATPTGTPTGTPTPSPGASGSTTTSPPPDSPS